MKRGLDRKYSSAFGLALLVLGGIAALSYGSLLRLQTTTERVHRTLLVVENINGVLSTLKDAETGQRGYLLTGNSNFLEPYETAIANLDSRLESLAKRTAHNPIQQQHLQQLRSLTRLKLAELQQTIALQKMKRSTAALTIVKTSRGKQLMDQIRALTAAMVTEEQQVLAQQSQQQQSNAYWSLGLIMGGTVIEAIALGMIFGALHQEARKLRQAQTALRQLNAELEQRVQSRTLELSETNQKLLQEIEQRQTVQVLLEKQMADIYDLYNNAPCGYQSLDSDGTFVQINETALGWLGYRRADLLHQKNFTDVLTPDSIPTFQKNFPLLKSGQRGSAEFDLILRDGSILPVSVQSTAVRDAEGNFVMTRCTLTDIRDRRRSEATLRDAERRWRSFLENVCLVVIGLDIDGTVNFANPFFFELTGYSAAEVLGKDWFSNFLPLHQHLAVKSTFHEILEHNFHEHYQNPVLTKSGRECLINWNNTLLRNEAGEITGTLSIGEDITHRQAVERLKNEFISIVSHELRTPLTSIRGSLGLLATGTLNDSPAQMQRMIEIAATDTERLVRLVNDILDLEHLESGKIVLTRAIWDVSTLIERSLSVMAASAQDAQVTLKSLPISDSLWVDGDRIIQTLTNLLSNAIKFSDPGAMVTLSAQRIENLSEFSLARCPLSAEGETAAPPPPLESLWGQAHILFQVTDQGRGIPSDQLETIFGRFQQVDASDSRSKGGTGLGLAICRSIVEQHGGSIWAESIWEKGSTFSVVLPADLPQPNLQSKTSSLKPVQIVTAHSGEGARVP
jgi:PAS domain S-box-containing protein